jgi:hypothetical protein
MVESPRVFFGRFATTFLGFSLKTFDTELGGKIGGQDGAQDGEDEPQDTHQ